jgi:hypothetical protein
MMLRCRRNRKAQTSNCNRYLPSNTLHTKTFTSTTPSTWPTQSSKDGSERIRTPSKARCNGVTSSPRSGAKTTSTLRSRIAVSAAQTCTCSPQAGVPHHTVRLPVSSTSSYLTSYSLRCRSRDHRQSRQGRKERQAHQARLARRRRCPSTQLSGKGLPGLLPGPREPLPPRHHQHIRLRVPWRRGQELRRLCNT